MYSHRACRTYSAPPGERGGPGSPDEYLHIEVVKGPDSGILTTSLGHKIRPSYLLHMSLFSHRDRHLILCPVICPFNYRDAPLPFSLDVDVVAHSYRALPDAHDYRNSSRTRDTLRTDDPPPPGYDRPRGSDEDAKHWGILQRYRSVYMLASPYADREEDLRGSDSTRRSGQPKARADQKCPTQRLASTACARSRSTKNLSSPRSADVS